MVKKFTGIEITGNSIKVVEISVSGKDMTATGMAEYPLDNGNGEGTLARLFVEGKIDARNVCTGVGAGKIFFRENSFPFRDKKKILQALPFSLAESLPFPMEEAMYDSFLPGETEGSTLVATVVVRKDAIKELEEFFAEAGARPAAISAENAAISTAFRPRDGEARDWISLHIGEERTIINCHKDKRPAAIRTIEKGTKDIISSLMSDLGVNEVESKDLLYTGSFKLDLEKMKKAEGTVRLFMDSIVREFQLLLRKTGQREESLPPVLLTGEGAAIKGAATYIEGETGIKIADSTPSYDLKIAEGLDLAELSTKGATALGYALTGASGKGIDFIRGRSRIFDLPFFKLLYGERKLLALASGLVLFLYTVSLAVALYTGNQRYAGLKESIRLSFREALPDIRRIVNEKHQLGTALAELEERVSLISDEGSVKVVDILRAVASSVPENTLFKVNRMTIDDAEVKIDGETENFDGVEKIKSALKNSLIFEDVEVGGAKASRLQKVIEFRLNVKLAK